MHLTRTDSNLVHVLIFYPYLVKLGTNKLGTVVIIRQEVQNSNSVQDELGTAETVYWVQNIFGRTMLKL